MANRWTEGQLQAIEARGSDLLVSAAAGSGKTAVLVEKAIPRPDGLAHADWAGFFMDDRYLIGCGMDSEEKYRQYPGIAVML